MERRTALQKSYHTISTQGQTNSGISQLSIETHRFPDEYIPLSMDQYVCQSPRCGKD